MPFMQPLRHSTYSYYFVLVAWTVPAAIPISVANKQANNYRSQPIMPRYVKHVRQSATVFPRSGNTIEELFSGLNVLNDHNIADSHFGYSCGEIGGAYVCPFFFQFLPCLFRLAESDNKSRIVIVALLENLPAVRTNFAWPIVEIGLHNVHAIKSNSK